MRAVDTNVVVRCLTGDNSDQAARARAAIGEGDISVGKAVLLESKWVLRRNFGDQHHVMIWWVEAMARGAHRTTA